MPAFSIYHPPLLLLYSHCSEVIQDIFSLRSPTQFCHQVFQDPDLVLGPQKYLVAPATQCH